MGGVKVSVTFLFIVRFLRSRCHLIGERLPMKRIPLFIVELCIFTELRAVEKTVRSCSCLGDTAVWSGKWKQEWGV